MSIRLSVALIAALVSAVTPAHAALDCLSDNELRVVVRSVYTRAIGRVMRVCADQHRNLDERARDAATNFLASYAEDMRANRLAANSIMARAHGEGWEALFDKMLVDSTAADEMWARSASLEDCTSEIVRVEDMTAADDYVKVMSSGMPRSLFDAERDAIPVCK